LTKTKKMCLNRGHANEVKVEATTWPSRKPSPTPEKWGQVEKPGNKTRKRGPGTEGRPKVYDKQCIARKKKTK